jgi:hypothetical protein
MYFLFYTTAEPRILFLFEICLRFAYNHIATLRAVRFLLMKTKPEGEECACEKW